MSNDITALAQRMSVERILEIAKGGTPTIGEKERLAITALYFHQELQICTKAFQSAGLAQLAAEEALEKALAQSSKWLEAYHKAVSVGARYEERIAEVEDTEQKLCAANVTLDARAEHAERRLAELEKAASEPVAWTDEAELRDVEKDGCGYLFKANPITPHADPRRVIKLYTASPEPESRPVTVKLPAEKFCPAEYAGSQLWSETEVWNKAITACADVLRAAGIQVIEGDA